MKTNKYQIKYRASEAGKEHERAYWRAYRKRNKDKIRQRESNDSRRKTRNRIMKKRDAQYMTDNYVAQVLNLRGVRIPDGLIEAKRVQLMCLRALRRKS